MKFTLYNALAKRICDREKGWIDFAPEFTVEHVENFVRRFGHGCSQETKDSLFNAAKNGFAGVKNISILNRVEFNEYEAGGVTYTPGQDMPHEVKIVRNHIKKYY